MRKIVVLLVLVSLLGLASFLTVRFYPYLFARKVTGEIVDIDRVTQPAAIIGGNTAAIPPSQLFSYAVAIRTTEDGKTEIVTASSEDRQWAVAQKGQCAEAKFFPYPPWNLDKAGTYHGARLLRLFDCPR